MPFQPDTFEPDAGVHGSAKRLNPKPILRHLRASSTVDRLEQTAWQRAYVSRNALPRYVQGVVLLGFEIIVGVAGEEILVSKTKPGVAIVVILVFLGAPTATWLATYLAQLARVPFQQRDEARKQVRVERQRFDEAEASYRESFERKHEETEGIRGQLGHAETLVRQLTEKNTELRTELGRLRPIAEFPDLIINVDNPVVFGTEQSKRYPNERETLIGFKVRVTNRELERKTNLTFKAWTWGPPERPSIRTLHRSAIKGESILPDPVKLGPQDTVEGELLFTWHHSVDVLYGTEATEEEVIEVVMDELRLNATDYISTVSVDLPLEGTWRRT
jgi:hypothetical protein